MNRLSLTKNLELSRFSLLCNQMDFYCWLKRDCTFNLSTLFIQSQLFTLRLKIWKRYSKGDTSSWILGWKSRQSIRISTSHSRIQKRGTWFLEHWRKLFHQLAQLLIKKLQYLLSSGCQELLAIKSTYWSWIPMPRGVLKIWLSILFSHGSWMITNQRS